jgi:hypothetical protein
MREIKPPNLVASWAMGRASMFIAGTIDNGNSEDWQTKLVAALEHIPYIDLYNPRRDDWDSTWKQDYSDPKFKEQVDWELEHIELADIVFFFIGKDSKSPISLMELGLVARHEDQIVIVFCEDGFYRKGNVDAICEKYGLVKVDNWTDAINKITTIVEDYWG